MYYPEISYIGGIISPKTPNMWLYLSLNQLDDSKKAAEHFHYVYKNIN